MSIDWKQKYLETHAELIELKEKYETDIKAGEETALTGYNQAYDIITELQERLARQKNEYEVIADVEIKKLQEELDKVKGEAAKNTLSIPYIYTESPITYSGT